MISNHRATAHRRLGWMMFLVMAFWFGPAATPAADAQGGGGQTVRVVSDAEGQRLQVDGRDFMVFGMNWGYVPIGENYTYDLWNQSDEFIKGVLAREMPMLKGMGVNTIRQYVGIPARWIQYIYETYEFYTVLNHPMARYGYTLDGTWIPAVDYSDPRLREAVTAEVVELVEQFRNTPGLLLWLLGNENNYGLSWSSFEIEALPEGERDAVRARYLYSLFGEITRAIQSRDANHPVAMANGDVQYLDIFVEECKDLDIFGTNVYRGISVQANRTGTGRDGPLFDVIKARMGIPVLFTEFGCDAWNAKEMREDEATQAEFLLGQWREIYEQSSGKGRAGNAIGGLIFQWSDGWWKFRQEERLDIHDTNASWPSAGYPDFVPGDNNMNEEWWGICAKDPPDAFGYYNVYPRAAYFALRRAFTLSPYAPGTDLAAIQAHFASIDPTTSVVEARGSKSSLETNKLRRARVSNVRIELSTYSTGGKRTTTPSDEDVPNASIPAFRGFDRMESFYAELEANPNDNIQGKVSFNVLGNVPLNPIDEIFYENRGVPRIVEGVDGPFALEGIERIKVYQGSITWDDRWFMLDGYYRTGHFHWGYEGDFFGLYREANYGPNIDTYNAQAPAGMEFTGKRGLDGLKIAFGPEVWWGANPTVLLKYRRNVANVDVTAMYQEDLASQERVNSSTAIPLPPTNKASLHVETKRGPFGIEVGGLWSGDTKVGETFQVVRGSGANAEVLLDEVRQGDAFGGKVKLTFQSGRWNWFAQAANLGIVSDGGPISALTFTNWHLKDTGNGNQRNLVSGLAVNVGHFQVSPNFLWQKPHVGPIPGDVPAPGVPRNVLDDPFAVRANREMTAGELLITYDPTPATWMWMWDNEIREDAKFAASLGYTFRNMPTTMDASIGILGNGQTFAFPGATPPRDLWELRARVVSRLSPDLRIAANAYTGTGEPNGDDPRLIKRSGVDVRVGYKSFFIDTYAKFNDWGPYDYHRDFNLTFPTQLMGDVSYRLGKVKWFNNPQTRVGVRGTWRSLDTFSPRYNPEGTVEKNGDEYEVRTYLHLSL